MFDNQTLEAYRSMKAPESLREKVMSSSDRVPVKAVGRRARLRPVYSFAYAAAACLVVAMSLWGFMGGGVTLEAGDPSSAGFSLARDMGTEEVTLDLEQRGFCRVSVSEGTLREGERSGDELLVFGEKVLTWELSDGAAELRISVRRFGTERSYLLTQNAGSGEWEIHPAE